MCTATQMSSVPRATRSVDAACVTVFCGSGVGEVSVVASRRARTSRAVALYRQAAATAVAAGTALEAIRPVSADQREQHDLAEHLRAAAAALVPGWLGAPLDAQAEDTPLGGPRLPAFVRVGTAQPLDDARFPVIIPLLGTGHLSIDADVRDARVAGLIRAVLLRLLAAAPAGSLLVRGVDAAAGSGEVFRPFAPLADAGLMPPAVTDRTGLRAVLAEAEQWLRPARPATARHVRRDRTLLLVIASLPELIEGTDLSRIVNLAQQGPEANLHLIVAGWPPPPLTAETTQPPLPLSTAISLRNPYAVIGDPPGTSFGSPLPHLPSAGLNAPVFLDDDPPVHLVDRVCRDLAMRFDADAQLRLADLLPDEAEELWREDATKELAVPVGLDGDRPVILRFNDRTPNWMIGGRPGSGKTAFLVNVLYNLASRYGPDELSVHLLDFTEGRSFAELLPTERDPSWLPQVRTAGAETDREYGVALLRELATELSRRSAAAKEVDAADFGDLRKRLHLSRILCVIDEFQALVAGGGSLADEATRLVESLARKGRRFGIHLVLVGRSVLGDESSDTSFEAILGQFPVRVALPGGGHVLEPTNDAAVGLPLGYAVVNTAGGLGGPRGATRGHERTVRFPDPCADPEALTAVRHRLWAARDPRVPPPQIFAGYAPRHLDDDPDYRAVLARPSARPVALLGRTLDVSLSAAAVPFDTSPRRHLAVLGPSPLGADVLEAAARSLAVHHASRTVRFVVTSLVPGHTGRVAALAAELAERQEVEVIDGTDLVKALDLDRPGYLIAYGMDVIDTDQPTMDRLRHLLRHGPSQAFHLLSWWREVRRLTEVLGRDDADEIGGLVFLDVPADDVSLLLGHPVEWQPRSNRALLHDRTTGRTTTIVPFTRPEPAS